MTHAVIDGPVHIIGAGTLGMHIARSLDELGPERIKSPLHFWDGDRVEPHNTRVQLFRDEHIGMFKTDAAQDVIGRWSGLEVVSHPQFIDERVELTGTVFVCVHTMAARRRIWQTCLRDNGEVLMIESRVGQDTATIHVLDPSEKNHKDMWEHYTSYADPPGPPVSCGETVSLGPIAPMVAQIAAWQLVRFCEIVSGSDDRLANQIQIGMRPPRLESYFW